MDLVFFARYPFTQAARNYASSKKLSVDEHVLALAQERVRSSIVSLKLDSKMPSEEKAVSDELASYAAARLLTSLLERRYLMNRYAVAESKRVKDFLDEDLEKKNEAVYAVAKEFDAVLEPIGLREWLMDSVSYLKNAPAAPEYRLANQKLKSGMVTLSSHQVSRVLSEAVKNKISKELPLPTKNLPPVFAQAAQALLQSLPKEIREPATPIAIEAKDYPPCIKKLLNDLAGNENLPHVARFFLCVYLLNTGMSEDNVCKLFMSAPDYEEKTTRYQVSFAKKKAYKTPSCRMVDLYGLCVANCGIKSPLSYKSGMENRVKIWQR